MPTFYLDNVLEPFKYILDDIVQLVDTYINTIKIIYSIIEVD